MSRFTLLVSGLTAMAIAICGCGEQAPAKSEASGAQVSPAPSAEPTRFSFSDQACDPTDPRIAAAGLKLPAGNGPEAQIAAACLALEWLAQPAADPTIVTEVRGPTVHPQRNATDVDGLLAMERLVGHRYQPVGTPILLLVAGSDVEWACDYGRKEIDPRITRPMPWTEEWLGCTTKRWACGGSNIQLSDGVRFIFGACPKQIIDGSKAPPASQRWNGLRSGHESIQILFYQLTNGDWGLPRGTWGGLIARSAGIQYFERAAAWLAGTPRDWRFDESGSGQYESARDAWKAWRKSAAGSESAFDFGSFVTQDFTTIEDPAATLSSSVAAFAAEYLIAHWGVDALFAWLGGARSFEEVFGESEEVLFSRIGAYVQLQFEGG